MEGLLKVLNGHCLGGCQKWKGNSVLIPSTALINVENKKKARLYLNFHSAKGPAGRPTMGEGRGPSLLVSLVPHDMSLNASSHRELELSPRQTPRSAGENISPHPVRTGPKPDAREARRKDSIRAVGRRL